MIGREKGRGGETEKRSREGMDKCYGEGEGGEKGMRHQSEGGRRKSDGGTGTTPKEGG